MSATLAALLLPVVALVVYAIPCAWWSLRKCLRCKGEGSHPRLIRRSRTQLCHRCRGTGQSVRAGRRLADRIRTTRSHERAAS